MPPSKKFVVAVGAVLLESRREAGLTQQELAARIRMDRSYLSDIERAKASVSLEMFFRICGAIGVSTSGTLSRIEAKLRK